MLERCFNSNIYVSVSVKVLMSPRGLAWHFGEKLQFSLHFLCTLSFSLLNEDYRATIHTYKPIHVSEITYIVFFLLFSSLASTLSQTT